jgi:hypothetical protein
MPLELWQNVFAYFVGQFLGSQNMWRTLLKVEITQINYSCASLLHLVVLSIFLACIVLHNFLRSDDLSEPSGGHYCPPGFADIGDEENGGWRQEEASMALRNINQLSSNMHTAAAKAMRDNFADYFINEGTVEWQRRIVGLEQ